MAARTNTQSRPADRSRAGLRNRTSGGVGESEAHSCKKYIYINPDSCVMALAREK